MKTGIEMAREAGIIHPEMVDKTLERFAELVRADEREACAKVAGWLWQQFQDTKDAHERNSMEPFKWGQFGFDQSTVQQSKRMMDAIRARSQA